ncbi:hypothetical protein BKA93DRAFT_401937 [Sparassis latifolia]
MRRRCRGTVFRTNKMSTYAHNFNMLEPGATLELLQFEYADAGSSTPSTSALFGGGFEEDDSTRESTPGAVQFQLSETSGGHRGEVPFVNTSDYTVRNESASVDHLATGISSVSFPAALLGTHAQHESIPGQLIAPSLSAVSGAQISRATVSQDPSQAAISQDPNTSPSSGDSPSPEEIEVQQEDDDEDDGPTCDPDAFPPPHLVTCMWDGGCGEGIYNTSAGGIQRHLRGYHVPGVWRRQQPGRCKWHVDGQPCNRYLLHGSYSRHILKFHIDRKKLCRICHRKRQIVYKHKKDFEFSDSDF